MVELAMRKARKRYALYHELWHSRKGAFFGVLVLDVLKWSLLAVVLVFTVGPILWAVMASFKTNYELFNSALAWPESFNLDNYKRILELDGVGQAFINTVIVSGLSTALCLIISAMAAYTLRFSFRFKHRVNFLLVMGIYIPVNAFMIPYCVITNTLGVYNTVWGLIMVYTGMGLPLSILVLKGYMDTIPDDIMEAASIDGCGFFRTFSKVMLPLSVPGLSTIGIFQFITCWNEFLYATLLTQDVSSRTLQVSMRFFQGFFVTDYGATIAMIVVCILPTIVAYIFFQEKIIEGMTSGALKA